MESTPMAVIAENLNDNVLSVARDINAHSLNLWWETLRVENVRQSLDAGFSVNVWTVNDPALAPTLYSWGVTSIISDRPQDFPAT